MQLKSFFTRQRYIILAAGIIFFVAFLVLSFLFGHATELEVLSIDLAGSAITIIATALVIEYLQYREQAQKTHQVAKIAEEEIKAISYRVKLAVATLYGFTENTKQHSTLRSLDDIEKYLKTNMQRINEFYDKDDFKKPSVRGLADFKAANIKLETEIKDVINLFDYALPYTLRAYVLALRSNLQIAERTVTYIDQSSSVSSRTSTLMRELTATIYDSANEVLNHESRTSENQSLAKQPGRVGKKSG